MTERERMILEVMTRDNYEPTHPGRIGLLAFGRHGRRTDTGARNTLLAMRRKGLVDAWRGAGQWGADYWYATKEGQAALEAHKSPGQKG